ncbi:MAG: HD domain-containing protein [Clostridiales bacterium]|nr:HD domain-containing protein [Clostridiales bacterium]
MGKRYGFNFWKSLLYHQNKHHAHGVFIHTLKVVYHLGKKGRWDLVPAGVLHDIAKPLTAQPDQDDIDEGLGGLSFEHHEFFGWYLIRNWPTWLVSDYTKNVVRYHYLIRGMTKAKIKGNYAKYRRLRRIWDKLSPEFQEDLGAFMLADDRGKKAW